MAIFRLLIDGTMYAYKKDTGFAHQLTMTKPGGLRALSAPRALAAVIIAVRPNIFNSTVARGPPNWEESMNTLASVISKPLSPVSEPFVSRLLQYAHAKTALDCLAAEIRHMMAPVPPNMSCSQVATSEVKEGVLDGKAIQRVVMVLRSSGCVNALKKGSCTMCGHVRGTTRGNEISVSDFKTQIDEELSKFDWAQFPMLCVYNSGSFLNPDELPIEARDHILKRISDIHSIRRLVIESRPEFITPSVLDTLEGTLTNTELEIGVGLESSDDVVRDLLINKNFTTIDYLNAVSVMRGRRVNLLTYVLLKSPFLTEREAIDDAQETIEFAFRTGAHIVSIEPVSVQDFTLVHFLHEVGQFRTPWIWSVIEVLRRTYHLGHIRLGGFEFFPLPSVFVHNCARCNGSMIQAIRRFNETENIHVFDGLACQCERDWHSDLRKSADYLPERILATLAQIDSRIVLERMVEKFQATNIVTH